MATNTYQVQSYSLKLSREMTIGGGAVKFYAQAVCNGAGGERFVAFFLRDDSNPQPNIYNPGAKWATVYLPAEQYPWYVDMLRNEKPVYAYMNSDRPSANRLYTGNEPVGEDED